MDFDARLHELGITLPEPAQPLAAYVPALVVGNWAFVSGQLPVENGQLLYGGKMSDNEDTQKGYQAARLCAINCLAALRQATGGLDRVVQVVKLTGYVASADGFTAQPAVLNGASELMEAVFGEAGRHARAAVGVSQLPLGALVEIEMMVKLTAE